MITTAVLQEAYLANEATTASSALQWVVHACKQNFGLAYKGSLSSTH